VAAYRIQCAVFCKHIHWPSDSVKRGDIMISFLRGSVYRGVTVCYFMRAADFRLLWRLSRIRSPKLTCQGLCGSVWWKLRLTDDQWRQFSEVILTGIKTSLSSVPFVHGQTGAVVGCLKSCSTTIKPCVIVGLQ